MKVEHDAELRDDRTEAFSPFQYASYETKHDASRGRRPAGELLAELLAVTTRHNVETRSTSRVGGCLWLCGSAMIMMARGESPPAWRGTAPRGSSVDTEARRRDIFGGVERGARGAEWRV